MMRMNILSLATILLAQVVIVAGVRAASTLEEAGLAYQNQAIEQAIQLYQRGLQEDPRSLDAKAGLAYCYFVKRQYPRATKLVNDILTTNSGHVRGLLLRARLYMQSENLDAAKTALQQAVNIDPNNAEVHTALGNALYSLGDVKEADAHYNTARSLVSPGR